MCVWPPGTAHVRYFVNFLVSLITGRRDGPGDNEAMEGWLGQTKVKLLPTCGNRVVI